MVDALDEERPDRAIAIDAVEDFVDVAFSIDMVKQVHDPAMHGLTIQQVALHLGMGQIERNHGMHDLRNRRKYHGQGVIIGRNHEFGDIRRTGKFFAPRYNAMFIRHNTSLYYLPLSHEHTDANISLPSPHPSGESVLCALYRRINEL